MYKKITSFVSSKKFFYILLGGFVVESAWIALSSVYPMAFDEDFHVGIIQIYAHHISPFFAQQPANANAYGALVRDPSYLYHYLMSFPYRLVSLFSTSLTAHVLVLRFIDIAFFAWGLVLFRKLLLKTKAPATWVHIALLFFILIPAVPLLAGQVNYDDLLFPLTALALLWTVEFVTALKNKRLSTGRLAALVTLCLLASLVKYAFLPIAVGIAVYVLYSLRQYFKVVVAPRTEISKSWAATKGWVKTLAVVSIVMSAGLFVQSYGVNALKYRALVPACDKVLSTEACSNYGPWMRNYQEAQIKGQVDINPLRFSASWFYGLFERSFFSVNGPDSNYKTYPPVPILSITAAVVGIAGVIVFIYFRREILRQTPYLGFLLLVGAFYAVVLWVDDYQSFLYTGQTVAINGRYMFPVLPPMLLAIGLGYQRLFTSRPELKLAFVGIVCVLFLEGGGALSFIVRSDSSWYWPNTVVKTINNDAQKVLDPIIVR